MTEARAEKFATAAADDIVRTMFMPGAPEGVFSVVRDRFRDSIKASILKLEWAETLAKIARSVMCNAVHSKAVLEEGGA